MDPPAVSVVVIFLDEARFMREAIGSVFAQTYDRWELLLVDDGSTDGSSDIAREYGERYPERVRCLEHPGHDNRGMSATRNLGIKHARGRFIAFLDADDVWLPHKLERQVAILESHPAAAMVYGRTEYWSSWTGDPADRQRDRRPALGMPADTLIEPPAVLIRCLRFEARTPCPSDILVRREIVDEVGGFEDEFRGLFEDQVFLAKIFLKAPVFVAEECWDRYRIHSESSMSVAAKAGTKYEAGLFYLDWLATYLRANGIRHREVWRALRANRLRFRHPGVYAFLQRTRRHLRSLTSG
jgi:glycosyltransferase involved in cell wall biosynthesis